MPETPKYHLRYPSTTSRPSASQLREIAEDVEDVLKNVVEEVPIVESEGKWWGVAYDPTIHRRKVFTRSVVNETSAGGDIDLLALSAEFVGVASAVASFGDTTSGHELALWVFNNSTLVARCLASSGAAAVGNQRINFVVWGWVAR